MEIVGSKIELLNLKFEDYLDLKNTMIEVYRNLDDPYWSMDDIKILLKAFPEGNFASKSMEK